MSAAEVAAALGGKREGRQWRCLCPVHGGAALAIADGRHGSLLLWCFGGCDAREVFAELRASGVINGREPFEKTDTEHHRMSEAERMQRRIVAARDLYRRAASAVDSPASAYLRSRGITIAPSSLRWLRHCPHRNGRYYPAMVAPVVDVGGAQLAVHKTFLRADSSGKADLPKEEQRETCGPMKGGAVRFGLPQPGEWLVIGEGIESTLAALQIFGIRSGWAALSANGLRNLLLPLDARQILIAADNDANGVGQAAARDAAWFWEDEGRTVQVAVPPDVGTDFNDILIEAH